MVTTSDSLGAPVAPSNAPQDRHPVPEVDWTPTRVLMLVQISGTRDGRDWPSPGAVIELPAHEAAALIRQFTAVPAPEPDEAATVAETAEAATVNEPSEQAVAAPPARRATTSRARSARPGSDGSQQRE